MPHSSTSKTGSLCVEGFAMHYSTEWVIVILVVGCALGVVYQAYASSTLWVLLPASLIGVLFMAGLHVLETRRQRKP
jgi:F0F1-type ATP synthase assembly protein I